MNPAAMVQSAISRIGESVTLMRRGECRESFQASIQPRFHIGNDASGPAGWGGAGRYMLYAPADSPALTAGDKITCRESVYHITQAENIYLSGELLYRQARLYGEEGDT